MEPDRKPDSDKIDAAWGKLELGQVKVDLNRISFMTRFKPEQFLL